VSGIENQLALTAVRLILRQVQRRDGHRHDVIPKLV
jgi:hypothetical protein